MSISEVISLDLMDDAKSAFDIFDDAKDGYISGRCIERALRAIGLNPTSEEMIDILRDTENQMISFHAFLYIIYKHSRNVDTSAELVDSLKVLDKDGSGWVYIDDLTKLCKCICRPFSDEQIKSVLDDCNLERGKVNSEEFINKLLFP